MTPWTPWRPVTQRPVRCGRSVIDAGHDPRRFATDLLDRFRDLIVLPSGSGCGQSRRGRRPDDVLDRMRDQAARVGSTLALPPRWCTPGSVRCAGRPPAPAARGGVRAAAAAVGQRHRVGAAATHQRIETRLDIAARGRGGDEHRGVGTRPGSTSARRRATGRSPDHRPRQSWWPHTRPVAKPEPSRTGPAPAAAAEPDPAPRPAPEPARHRPSGEPGAAAVQHVVDGAGEGA